jgi:6-phosphofructokinase 1
LRARARSPSISVATDMPTSLERPPLPRHRFGRVAILFSGGPAPAANAVISTAAVSFVRNGALVFGIRNGYSRLVDFAPDRPLVPGTDYVELDHRALKRTRNLEGVMIGTARTNPGRNIAEPAHLDDPVRCAPLQRVHAALRSLGAEALISIGGDDTLKTANIFRLWQQRLPAGEPRIAVVHVPKTIDNDYNGIDFTFGYFTAVDTLAHLIRNLLFDAEATQAYFLIESMGRSAGWLAYGAAIASEASLVIGVEDIRGELRATEVVPDARGGPPVTRAIMDVGKVTDLIVDTMLAREDEGKQFGTIVLAEGLAELLPHERLRDVRRDEHGHISIGTLNLAQMFEQLVAQAFERRTGRKRKVKGLQLGYEARCARPHAFDVILGSQLGVGAYRALAEKDLDAVMISVVGQLQLQYVPFDKLVDPRTLKTVVRTIQPGSDFHQLARFLETYH